MAVRSLRLHSSAALTPIIVMTLGLGLTGGAFADLLSTFELDGNAVTQNAGIGLPDDWDRVNGYVSGNSGQPSFYSGVLPDAGNVTVFLTNDRDLFDVNTWGWTDTSVPNKDNITNAYAALYPDGKVFFGLDRYAQPGDTYVGFWFFQNQITCNLDGTFNGSHQVGDILVLSDLMVSAPPSIRVYKWVGSGGSDGSLDSLHLTPSNAYAVANVTIQPSPWPYVPASGTPNQFPVAAFLEGGVDLAALGASSSFASVLAETRGSYQVNAGLKDFVVGGLQQRVGVDDATPTSTPGPQFRIHQSYPNPFNPLCTIPYEISRAGRVNLRVLDVTGAAVRTLVDRWREPGRYAEFWDGRTDCRTDAPSGVYICRLEVDGGAASRKMVLLR